MLKVWSTDCSKDFCNGKINRDLLIKAFTGEDDAQYQLSLHYYLNEDMENEAIFWLKRSILKGNLQAMELLQEINTKNYLLKCTPIKKRIINVNPERKIHFS